MTYQGHIENGVIVLDTSAILPDGAKVRVELVSKEPIEASLEENGQTHYERYKSIIGAAKGLPEDFAAEHDHYIHGTPKRSETESPSRTIAERLSNVIGKGKDLPSDFAENHDHYIHGAPKE